LRLLFSFLERGLQLLDLLVQIFLALRQLAETVEHLTRFALLRSTVPRPPMSKSGGIVR